MKWVKRIALGALLSSILLIYIGMKTVGAPAITYVYSESMEPIIQVNDGFFITPSFQSEVGDIVVFRPSVLDADLVTHRIVGVGSEGFITKGDNLTYTDQENGEPELVQENIVGKVFEINNRPLTFSNMGKWVQFFNERKISFRLTGALFLLIGVGFGIYDSTKNEKRERNSRRRLRLWSVGRNTVTILSLILLVQLLTGGKVEKVTYLISVNPSVENQHFHLHDTGHMVYRVQNHSFLPVWYLPKTRAPLKLEKVPKVLPPLSEQEMILEIPPHSQTGWYNGYVRSYTYPALLPKRVVEGFHQIHPFFSAFFTTVVFYFLLLGLMRVLFWVLGIYPRTPFKALHSKENRQHLKWIKSRLGISMRRR